MTHRALLGICAISMGFICSCSSMHKPAPPPPTPIHQGQQAKLNACPPFHKVAIDGPFDVVFYRKPNTYSIDITNPTVGEKPYPAHVSQYVQDDTLYVSLAGGYLPDNNRLILSITTPELTKLHYNGPGNVIAHQVDTTRFTLDQEGDGLVTLEGHAKRFDATVAEQARLNAKCLKSHTIFINTVDMAQAEVTNSFGLSAFATRYSNIYYYQDPSLVAPYLRTSGSVIRMVGVTPYNVPNDIFGPEITCLTAKPVKHKMHKQPLTKFG